MSTEPLKALEDSKGMIIDGPIGTHDTDSSGERLDVEGADISSLEKDGVLNIEHADTEKQGFSSVIGKCIYARKIQKKDDVEHPRELYFWKKLETPFIYAQFRLFDGSGHDEARAAAAIIRDTLAHKEPVLIRYSVEGSTLQKDGNVLTKTVIRRVAATIKPCNKAVESGVLADPNNTFHGSSENTQKTEQNPEFSRLGKAYDTIYEPGEAFSLDKGMEAGVGSGAPSTLTQGAALGREWLGNKSSKDPKKKVKKLLDPVSEVYKWESLYVDFKLAFSQLKKSEDDPVEPKNMADYLKFEGQDVKHMGSLHPTMKSTGGALTINPAKKFHLLHMDGSHYYGVPATPGNKTRKDVVKFPFAKKNINYQVFENEPDDPYETEKMDLGKLSAAGHGLPEYNNTKDQNALIHGLPLTNSDYPPWYKTGVGGSNNFWTKSANDDWVYVKVLGNDADDKFFDPHQEMMFHNVARDFWKMGPHISTTAIFKHPVTGQPAIAVQAVPNAKHVETHIARERDGSFTEYHGPLDAVDEIDRMRSTGELDKFGIMDYVMGNADRNHNNLVYSPIDKKIHLFDHGYGEGAGTQIHFPYYFDIGGSLGRHPFTEHALPIFQSLKWDDLMREVQKYPQGQIPAVQKGFAARILKLGDYLQRKGHWRELFRNKEDDGQP